MNSKISVDRMLEFFGGSPSKLASAVGLKRQNVEHWIKTGVVPAERCPAIEAATGGLVRCEDLRPDVRWDVLRGNCYPTPVNTAQAATENVANVGGA